MGNTYKPDKWVIIKVNSDSPHYRVLAAWFGNELISDSWRINSGITSVEVTENTYKIYGSSGSCYEVKKSNYGLALVTEGILKTFSERNKDLLELLTLPEDLENFKWGI